MVPSTPKICNIFYSWQTDLPNATNRGFIQTALENAAKLIRDDESIQIEPVIDRDTSGVPGAPDIADTILAKIAKSQIFVADVSIINIADPSRKTPNPNVLIELGYAIKTLGFDRILMVMNQPGWQRGDQSQPQLGSRQPALLVARRAGDNLYIPP